MNRHPPKRALLAAAVAVGSPFVAVGTGAQSSVSPASDFRFDSAFSLDPPDATYWEPPPGGLIEDGRYVGRAPGRTHEVFLTLGTEYSGAFLKSPQWQDETFIRSYHEQLLEAQLADLQEGNVDRVVSSSSASLDTRFRLPAIARRVLVNDVSRSTGRATRTVADYTWRFPHPHYPIVEFVVSISTVIDPGEQAPDISPAELGFLASVEALRPDMAPDISIPVPGKRLDAIAEGDGALWVTDYQTSTLIRVDMASRLPSATVRVGAGPHSIETTDGAVWVANHNDDSIMRIDPLSNAVDLTGQVPAGPHQILAHGSALWLVADASCLVTEIDPGTAQPWGDALSFGGVRRSLSGRRERLWALLGRRVDRCTDLSVTMAASDAEQLYVFERFKGTLTRIDHGRGIKLVDTGAEIGGFVIVERDLWGVDDLDANGKVYRVDISSGEILATIEGGRVSGTPIFAGGLIWITRQRDNTVIRIDPATNAIRGAPLPMNQPTAMVADDAGVWISGGNSIVRIPFE